MLIYSLLLLLLLIAVTLKRGISILFSRISIIILLYCINIAIFNLYLIYLKKGIGLYGGLFICSSNTQVFQIFMLLITMLILLLTGFNSIKIWIKNKSNLYNILFCKFFILKNKKLLKQHTIIEYPLIILFIITGAFFLISSNDLISMFLSLELQSYGLYLLSTLYRNSELATSAGLTYFLLGGLSSSFILLSIGLIYSNIGTTSLDCLYIISNLKEITEYNNFSVNLYEPHYIYYSLLIMSVGFLFKISAAPFHFWSPDVYDAIPTIVTTFVSIIPKISIFLFFLELVHSTNNYIFNSGFTWTISLSISCLLSLIIGTVLGLTQFRIKRLLAYSTISHIGFILLALYINDLESTQAFIFYIMQYTITNLNAFFLLISIGFSLYFYKSNIKQYDNLYDIKNSPIQLISQLKGYFLINPIIAISLSITIFSLIGIPPLLGFFAKQMVLSAALDKGYIFISIIAILSSVIGAVYYLNVIKHIFFYKVNYFIKKNIKNLYFKGYIIQGKKNKIIMFKIEHIILSNSLTVTISILTLIILLFIFLPQEWLSLTNILAIILFNY